MRQRLFDCDGKRRHTPRMFVTLRSVVVRTAPIRQRGVISRVRAQLGVYPHRGAFCRRLAGRGGDGIEYEFDHGVSGPVDPVDPVDLMDQVDPVDPVDAVVAVETNATARRGPRALQDPHDSRSRRP